MKNVSKLNSSKQIDSKLKGISCESIEREKISKNESKETSISNKPTINIKNIEILKNYTNNNYNISNQVNNSSKVQKRNSKIKIILPKHKKVKLEKNEAKSFKGLFKRKDSSTKLRSYTERKRRWLNSKTFDPKYLMEKFIKNENSINREANIILNYNNNEKNNLYRNHLKNTNCIKLIHTEQKIKTPKNNNLVNLDDRENLSNKNAFTKNHNRRKSCSDIINVYNQNELLSPISSLHHKIQDINFDKFSNDKRLSLANQSEAYMPNISSSNKKLKENSADDSLTEKEDNNIDYLSRLEKQEFLLSYLNRSINIIEKEISNNFEFDESNKSLQNKNYKKRIKENKLDKSNSLGKTKNFNSIIKDNFSNCEEAKHQFDNPGKSIGLITNRENLYNDLNLNSNNLNNNLNKDDKYNININNESNIESIAFRENKKNAFSNKNIQIDNNKLNNSENITNIYNINIEKASNNSSSKDNIKNAIDNNDQNSDKEALLIIDSKRLMHKKLSVYDSLSECEENPKPAEFSIKPDSYVKLILDFFCFWIIIFSLIYSPIKIIFYYNLHFSTASFYVELIFDVILILDFIAGFFTGFYDFEENYISKIKFMALNYLRSCFLVDLISAFPFNSLIEYYFYKLDYDYVMGISYMNNSKFNFHFIDYYKFHKNKEIIGKSNLNANINMSDNAFDSNLSANNVNNIASIQQNTFSILLFQNQNKLFLLMKIIRVIKIIKIVSENSFLKKLKHILGFDSLFQNNKFLMLLYFLYFLIISHICSCIYIFLATLTFEKNWVSAAMLQDESFYSLYLNSLYFNHTTIFTVGYGDILSKNLYERCYNIILMLVGVMLYSFALTYISSMIQKIEKEANIAKNNDKREFLHHLNLKYNINTDLHQKISRHLLYGIKLKSDNIFEFLAELPIIIRNELILHIFGNVVNNFSFFKNCGNDNEFIINVVLALKPTKTARNDILINQGDFIEEIIMLKAGKLTVEIIVNRRNEDEDQKLKGFSNKKTSNEINLKDLFMNAARNYYDENRLEYKNSITNNAFNNCNVAPNFGRFTFENKFNNLVGFNNNTVKVNKKSSKKNQSKNNKAKSKDENINLKGLEKLKILELRENEHFGDALMIENKKSPVTLKTKTGFAELYLIKKLDVLRLSNEFPEIFEKIYVKSSLNMMRIHKCIEKAKIIREMKLEKIKFENNSNKKLIVINTQKHGFNEADKSKKVINLKSKDQINFNKTKIDQKETTNNNLFLNTRSFSKQNINDSSNYKERKDISFISNDANENLLKKENTLMNFVNFSFKNNKSLSSSVNNMVNNNNNNKPELMNKTNSDNFNTDNQTKIKILKYEEYFDKVKGHNQNSETLISVDNKTKNKETDRDGINAVATTNNYLLFKEEIERKKDKKNILNENIQLNKSETKLFNNSLVNISNIVSSSNLLENFCLNKENHNNSIVYELKKKYEQDNSVISLENIDKLIEGKEHSNSISSRKQSEFDNKKEVNLLENRPKKQLYENKLGHYDNCEEDNIEFINKDYKNNLNLDKNKTLIDLNLPVFKTNFFNHSDKQEKSVHCPFENSKEKSSNKEKFNYLNATANNLSTSENKLLQTKQDWISDNCINKYNNNIKYNHNHNFSSVKYELNQNKNYKMNNLCVNCSKNLVSKNFMSEFKIEKVNELSIFGMSTAAFNSEYLIDFSMKDTKNLKKKKIQMQLEFELDKKIKILEEKLKIFDLIELYENTTTNRLEGKHIESNSLKIPSLLEEKIYVNLLLNKKLENSKEEEEEKKAANYFSSNKNKKSQRSNSVRQILLTNNNKTQINLSEYRKLISIISNNLKKHSNILHNEKETTKYPFLRKENHKNFNKQNDLNSAESINQKIYMNNIISFNNYNLNDSTLKKQINKPQKKNSKKLFEKFRKSTNLLNAKDDFFSKINKDINYDKNNNHLINNMKEFIDSSFASNRSNSEESIKLKNSLNPSFRKENILNKISSKNLLKKNVTQLSKASPSRKSNNALYSNKCKSFNETDVKYYNLKAEENNTNEKAEMIGLLSKSNINKLSDLNIIHDDENSKFDLNKKYSSKNNFLAVKNESPTNRKYNNKISNEAQIKLIKFSNKFHEFTNQESLVKSNNPAALFKILVKENTDKILEERNHDKGKDNKLSLKFYYKNQNLKKIKSKEKNDFNNNYCFAKNNNEQRTINETKNKFKLLNENLIERLDAILKHLVDR